jgi:NAD(P)-dependent dehydrogenase (short-subunit alcohol dehydrogenase family)
MDHREPTKRLAMSDLFCLDGKVALVTGGSSGLGRGMARVLARHGATVAITGRNEERLSTVAAETAQTGRRVLAAKMDVGDIPSIGPTITAIEAALGPIDILVNNAGVCVGKRIVDVVPADYDEIMNTNLRGAYFVAAEIGQRMIARGAEGRIVNISSPAGLKPVFGLSLYSISKAALIHMTKAMAFEWARHNINVNAICPGHILTEMTEEFSKSDAGLKLKAGLPRKRMGAPEDLDTTLLALVSPASRFMTGAIVSVDDGICAT